MFLVTTGSNLIKSIFQKEQSAHQSTDPALTDFDPDLYSSVKAKVVGRKVAAVAKPESRWIVEVIGEGGRVDELLGEFFDYQSASRCSVTWAESSPDDLRLTREREVKLK